MDIIRLKTGYSFRVAAGMLDDVLGRLKEVGAEYAPITDRASTFGFYRWAKAAEKAGLKPLFGVELGVEEVLAEGKQRPSADFWTFLAKGNLAGVNRLVELSTTQFHYLPRLTAAQALAAKDVIKIIGSRVPQEVWENPPEGVYLALSPQSPTGYIKAALRAEKRPPFVACFDNRYVREGDEYFYEVLVGRFADIRSNSSHILSEEEWRSEMERMDVPAEIIAEALASASQIARECEGITMPKAKLPEPPRPDTLENMCREGAKKLGCDLTDPVYAARLKREIELIELKNFTDYFYIVADICKWARERMIVGPARGSSCGSLVCWLLGITTIDPIPYGLIFERFIDVNRDDMPDIDIDFSDQQRYMVFDYVNRKYGADRVARLGTVAMYKPRSALQEVGTALSIPKWMCDAVAESLIERSSGDSRALNSLEDTLAQTPSGRELIEEYPEALLAARFEGHPRHYSQHAAGIVLADKPITDYVAVDHRTGATMCDKKDAEDGYGLLKIDALGLTQLSVFEDALELAGLPRNHLETIPLDDPAAFKVLNDGKWSGIFQFNGKSLQVLTGMFTVDCFNDIVSITALARPGPLASGGANEWAWRRNGTSEITYPHPIFKPYLEDTQGIVLYQEQVMEIGRNIGDLDWGQVTALRKAMSKSLGKEFFDQFGDPWKKGAMAKGVPAAVADKVWDDLCAYGSWSFNKSHSVAYGLISYWCCWLKAHHPHAFAAATLSHEDKVERQIQLLREMISEGIDYKPVDPNYSTDKWSIGEQDGKPILVGPLSAVRGIGPKMVNTILSARARGERLPDRARKLLENPKTDIDSVWPIRDAFARILPDPLEKNIVTAPTPISRISIKPYEQTFVVFVTPIKIGPRDENEPVRVAKRGYEMKGETAYLNLQLADDTGTLFAQVHRRDFKRLAKEIIDRGRPSKALYAIKGKVRAGGTFLMLNIQSIKYIGDIDQ